MLYQRDIGFQLVPSAIFSPLDSTFDSVLVGGDQDDDDDPFQSTTVRSLNPSTPVDASETSEYGIGY